jgi:nuclear pore complex protein Nup93
MNEGGQSATGQLIEHVLTTHPAHPELLRLSEELEMDRYSGIALLFHQVD